MLWIIVAFLGGVGIGLLVGKICSNNNIVGNLRIDHSDPTDNPYLFLELSRDVHTLLKRKIVHLKVRREDFVSQK